MYRSGRLVFTCMDQRLAIVGRPYRAGMAPASVAGARLDGVAGAREAGAAGTTEPVVAAAAAQRPGSA